MHQIFLHYAKRHHLLVFFYAICLAVAGIGHGLDIFMFGWLPYKFAPIAFNFYWTMLAFADLVTALLLIAQLRIGVVLLIAIMISDVGINSYATFVAHYCSVGWALASQIIFMLLALAGAPYMWSSFNYRTNLDLAFDTDEQARRSI